LEDNGGTLEVIGPAGSQGAIGSTGATGEFPGPQGTTGATGPAGSGTGDGATGATGPAGSGTGDGATGATGSIGDIGPAGAAGITGITGIGLTGITGLQGLAGATGLPGATGTFGVTGDAYGQYLIYDPTVSNFVINPIAVTLGLDAGRYSGGAIPNTAINRIALGTYAGTTGQSLSGIAIGTFAGSNAQGISAIAIGSNAGFTNQRQQAIAIGDSAGSNTQSTYGVAIGAYAGTLRQSDYAVAIGLSAGSNTQGSNAVAIGFGAGATGQRLSAVAVGAQAGNAIQGSNAVAIGCNAGWSNQGFNAIAIGNAAGYTNQSSNSVSIGVGNLAFGGAGIESVNIGFESYAISNYSLALGPRARAAHSNTIVLSANSNVGLDSAAAGNTYIKPIAIGTTAAADGALLYNVTTGLVTYNAGLGKKTFVIDHPTDTDKYLVHACLEGPEAGVYYRGRAEIAAGADSTTVSLPDYVHKIASDFTIQITPIYTPEASTGRILAASETDGKTFSVHGMPGPFYWSVHGRRLSVEVEPLKATVQLKGDGPYTYLA
jgi:hypothetical protein